MPDPGLPGGDMSSCIDYFMSEEDMDEESAARLCQSLKEEEKSENGNVNELREALERAAGLVADVSVDFNSAVDVPAVNSKWVMMKSDTDGFDKQMTGRLVFKQDSDTEKRISYAPAMIPRQPDKEGDVVPTPVVENAAHDYLANDGEVDTDHSLVDGKGTVVESWVEPDERTWDLPENGTETYPAGTWMVGIKWESEPWQRIKNGELTGLSIYGMADHVPLGKCAECGESLSTAKGQNADSHKGDAEESTGMGDETSDTDDGPSISEVAASVNDLSDTVADVMDTLATVKDAVETEKQDAREAAQVLAEEYGLDGPEAVLDAVDAKANGDDEEMDEDEEEEDDEDVDVNVEASTEKRVDDANLEKGGDSRTTAQKGITDDETPAGAPSYAAVADSYEEGQ